MAPTFRFALRCVAVVSALAVCVCGASAAEHPARAARLVSFEGTTQIFGVGESVSDAGDVQANMPLLEGTQLRTGDDGRAEIEFEDGSLARLTPNSQVSLDALAEKRTDIGVAAGLVYLELHGDTPHPYAVHYGGSVVKIVTDAIFRVNIDEAPGELAVSSGEVVVANHEQKIIVRANETLRFDGSDSDRYFLTGSIIPDSWDQWNDDQDAAAADAASQQSDEVSRHAGDNSYGWSDLDAYGNWYPIPDAGDVWQPADAGADFDPYGSGSWGWYPGFGYTWISGYAWGWTPFHCGGWSYFNDFGWGWQPGTCYGWGSGVHYRRPPPGFKPPLRPIRPPRVVRVRHPVVPPGAAPHPGIRATPVFPIRKSTPVVVNGEIVAPLPRRSIARQNRAAEDAGSPALPRGGPFTRRPYSTAEPGLSTAEPGRRVGLPARIGPPAGERSPYVTRMPQPIQRPMPVAPAAPVHSSPAPVAAPHASPPPSTTPHK